VKDAGWCESPIDRFILAGLEANGLRPAAYQGTPIGSTGEPAERARIPFIENRETPGISSGSNSTSSRR